MDTTPENQAATFRNQDRVWPVRRVKRGGAVRALEPHARSLEDLTYRLGDLRLSVGDYMERRRTAGLLILKDGEVALERYGMGNDAQSLWTGFSTAKSITATLAGTALQDGAIASLDEACDHYLPRLKGSAYEGVTLRNLLRMCSGVAWREDYDAGARTEVYELGRALARRRPGAVLDGIAGLPRAHPQGAVFNYSTGDSCVLAAVLAAAVGRPLADYLAERVWGPGGMEADAHWQLDAQDGLEMGGFGVSARLRDMGRFGLLMLEDGQTRDGRRVLPAGWRDLASRPDSEATAFGALAPGDPGGYGYHWWSTPPAPGVHDGVFSAVGVFGQTLYINPGARVVAALQSAWRTPHDPAASWETVLLLRAAVRALGGDGGGLTGAR
jgi:CubicO group peptidase (beta-lactamase class C family)